MAAVRGVGSRSAAWRPSCIALAVAAVAVSCASTPDWGPPFPGCYFFQEGEAVERFRLPAGVRLTDRPLEGWPTVMQRGDAKVATTLTATGETDHPFAYWLEQPGDSLEVGYPLGGTVALDLAVGDGVLEGTVHSMSDMMSYGGGSPPDPMAVRLERGHCPDGGP
ncbi:MAG: hypothetical protein R3314_09805 [Longimicrobiales bacterium]|nr:hypothetical protein [Longimicrobiales bacterium]